jgi:hypothetical protein
MRSHLVRSAAVVAAFAFAAPLGAQAGVGSSLTPYAGYLVTGQWYDGPVGTNLSTTNAPMVGVHAGIPITRGIALVGSVGYASGDLRVGLPIIGGVNVGTAKMWLYDAGVELGGLAGKSRGIAPYVTAGIGGMTNDIENTFFSTRATNLAYTAGVGVDIGLADAFALRVQAKDYIGKFDSQEAVGFNVDGNLTHNWALTAGVKLRF